LIIAIDGTTASGKGTLAKRLADKYGLARLDTGALYRSVALTILDQGVDPHDEVIASQAALALSPHSIDEDRIRSAEVGRVAAIVAAQSGVRAALLAFQRNFAAQTPGAILDGRDIATVVCPHADVKFFVVADLRVRADRRWKELVALGEAISVGEVTQQITDRDARDMQRAIAPLKPTSKSLVLDTTTLSIEEMVDRAAQEVSFVLGKADQA
jgi:CMP/dCMP kinase